MTEGYFAPFACYGCDGPAFFRTKADWESHGKWHVENEPVRAKELLESCRALSDQRRQKLETFRNALREVLGDLERGDDPASIRSDITRFLMQDGNQ